jgi:hypothetical protein
LQAQQNSGSYANSKLLKAKIDQSRTWIRDNSGTAGPICTKFRIQDPIFARIMCKNMRRTIRALFAPFFPLFVQFYIIGAVTNQKAHFLKKSPFGEILRYPELFCKHSKTQGVMPIQNALVRLSKFQICFSNISVTA